MTEPQEIDPIDREATLLYLQHLGQEALAALDRMEAEQRGEHPVQSPDA